MNASMNDANAPSAQLDTAVVLVVFKRPDVTKLVFDAIASQRPAKLFILCDAARPHRPEEESLVAETKAIVENVDWPCQVYRRYADQNMGCEQSISTGLDWVFTHVDQAIVLEDDCLPNASFFTFCETMLAKYEDDPAVMSISGTQYLDNTDFCQHSYYFSKHFFCWGWATWKDSWAMYDRSMSGHEAFVREALPKLAVSENERVHIQSGIRAVLNGRLDSWAIRYAYAVLQNRGLCVQPHVNLVSNLGNGPNSTHCDSDNDGSMFNRPTELIEISSAPKSTERDLEAERQWAAVFAKPKQPGPIFSIRAWKKRIKSYRRSIAKRIPPLRRAA